MLTSLRKQYAHYYVLFMLFALITPSTEAFLSPKQRKKIRQEQRARRESPDEEYIYYNKIKCGIFGSCSLVIGVPATLIALIAPSTSDKIIFGLAGPILTLTGIYFLERCFRSGPGAIINEWGLRMRDYGLIIWEEIEFVDISRNADNELLNFILTDQTILTVNCAPLAGSVAAVIQRIQRFRDIRLVQTDYVSNRYSLHKKS